MDINESAKDFVGEIDNLPKTSVLLENGDTNYFLQEFINISRATLIKLEKELGAMVNLDSINAEGITYAKQFVKQNYDLVMINFNDFLLEYDGGEYTKFNNMYSIFANKTFKLNLFKQTDYQNQLDFIKYYYELAITCYATPDKSIFFDEDGKFDGYSVVDAGICKPYTSQQLIKEFLVDAGVPEKKIPEITEAVINSTDATLSDGIEYFTLNKLMNSLNRLFSGVFSEVFRVVPTKLSFRKLAFLLFIFVCMFYSANGIELENITNRDENIDDIEDSIYFARAISTTKVKETIYFPRAFNITKERNPSLNSIPRVSKIIVVSGASSDSN